MFNSQEVTTKTNKKLNLNPSQKIPTPREKYQPPIHPKKFLNLLEISQSLLKVSQPPYNFSTLPKKSQLLPKKSQLLTKKSQLLTKKSQTLPKKSQPLPKNSKPLPTDIFQPPPPPKKKISTPLENLSTHPPKISQPHSKKSQSPKNMLTIKLN